MAASLPTNIYESEVIINCDIIGKTIKARKIGEARDIAVKVISLDTLAGDSRSGLTKSIRSLAGISHPHLIEYSNVYTSNRAIFIEMKLLAAKPIDVYIRSYYRDNVGGIPEARLRDIVSQLARGINYLHKGCGRCILHGNICPHSIFYEGNHITITDYGLYLPLAKLHNRELAAGGYPDPPELQIGIINNSSTLAAQNVDCYTTKTDIWFLGCIVLDLCAHRLDRSSKLDIFEHFDQYLLGYSSSFRKMIQQCFSKNPLHRPDAADLVKCADDENSLSSRSAHSVLCRDKDTVSLKPGKTSKRQTLGNDIYLTTISKLQPTMQSMGQTAAVGGNTTCSTWSHDLTISQLNSDLLPRKTRHYYDLFPQWEAPRTLLLTARRTEDNAPVFLEGLDFERLSSEKAQLCIRRIKQVRDNPCSNIVEIHRVEQWKDKCYCEMEYPGNPTLRTVINDIFRADLRVPESFIWNVLLDVSVGLLHLLELDIPYVRLCSFDILMANTGAILTNIGSACSNFNIPLGSRRIAHNLLSLLAELNEALVSDGSDDALDNTYSQDLKDLIKYIRLVSKMPDSHSPRQVLMTVKDTSLGHRCSYDIIPFPLGVPPWLVPLIDAEDSRGIKENVERFHTCPPGALMYAIKKRKPTSLYSMCRLVAKLRLQTRIPWQVGIRVDELTPLMIGIKESTHIDIPREIAERDLLMRQHSGITALMIAAYIGKHEYVAHLLAEMGIQSDSGVTALMFAVTQRHRRCSELLLAEMGMQQADGTTALMLAVQVGDPDLINILLPEKHLQNSNGATAYDMATENGLHEYAQLLTLSTNGKNASEIVDRDLLSKKPSYQLVSVNERKTLPPGKFSNLMLAACTDDMSTIKKYSKSEAGLSSVEGKTALMIAAELGHTASAQRLAQVESGLKTTDGDAAIFIAIRNDNYKCVSVLCQYEGELTNKAGETPLEFAERMGHTRCIQALIKGRTKSCYLSTDNGLSLRQSKKLYGALKVDDLAAYDSSHQLQKPSHYSEGKESSVQAASDEEDATDAHQRQRTRQSQQNEQIAQSCPNPTTKHHNEEGTEADNCEGEMAHSRSSEKHPSNTNDASTREEIAKEGIEMHVRDSQTDNPLDAHVEYAEDGQLTASKQEKQKSNVNTQSKKQRGREKSRKRGHEYLEISGSTSDSPTESTIVIGDEPISIEVIHPENLKNYENRIAFLEPLQKRKSKKPRAVKTKTNLIAATERGDYEGIKKSLRTDAGKSYNGLTALMVAVKTDNLTLINLLARYECGIGQTDGTSALMMAVENGLVNAMYILMERDAGLIDKKGNTALLRLLSSPCPQTCIPILAKVEGRIPRKDGQTPLMLAMETNNTEGIEALVPIGTKLFNKDGQTALMIAAMGGRAKYVELLMPHEERMADKKGMTALMYAAAAGHAECVGLLVKREKGMQSKQRCTALHYAVVNNRAACVKLLLDNEENIPNGRGLRCLSIAKAKQFHECVELLSALNRDSQED